jgi:hypothetical protein
VHRVSSTSLPIVRLAPAASRPSSQVSLRDGFASLGPEATLPDLGACEDGRGGVDVGVWQLRCEMPGPVGQTSLIVEWAYGVWLPGAPAGCPGFAVW